MNTFSFTDAQVEVLRLALIHELNENSYFKGLCKTDEQRIRVALARAELEEIYSILSNRRPGIIVFSCVIFCEWYNYIPKHRKRKRTKANG